MLKKRCFSLALSVVLVLGAYKGYVALYNEGEAEPRQIYPYPVNVLPPADQKALEAGIPVRTDEELNRLLEDFLS